eukprot:TRINITY_DN5092_c0_g1_i1.p1 TRINITY_DN5092_c0_g1~~TRINITY_DN5092_c0_g1_i1.p1  ORF type:complete len:734 (+),score=185.73 TRINITY_DN5092_c0_g1_i1:40-2241(+)
MSTYVPSLLFSFCMCSVIVVLVFFFLMIRRPPRSTLSSSSAASDVYKRQVSTQSTGNPTLSMSHTHPPELLLTLADPSPELTVAVIKRLQESGLEARRVEGVDHDAAIVITATMPELEKEAEIRGLQKQTVEVDPISQLRRHEIFTRGEGKQFEGYGTSEFFLPFERVTLVQSLLDAARVGSELHAMLDMHQDSFLKEGLRRAHKLEEVRILHDEAEQSKLMSALRGRVLVPVQEVRDYFGSEVAFYFAWLNFFTVWLVIPGVFGLLLWALRPEGVSVDNSPRIPAFTIFVALWGITFLAFWRRRAAEWACTWDTLDCDDAWKMEDIRIDFAGELVVSPVTGFKQLHYPSWKRWYIWYPLSVLVSLFMLAVAFGFMCLSLNLQGYVHGSDEFDAHGRRHFESPIHVQAIAAYAQPGAIFDPDLGYVMPLVPVVIHVVMVMILNAIYGMVAEWLTSLENHRTEHDHQSSLIAKRFLFEAFDAYIGLFYIAFYELDVTKLRTELVAVYTADSARRVVIEVVIPRVMKFWSTRSAAKKSQGALKKNDDLDPCMAAVQDALLLGEYEPFDDYLEMVIEFGYVVLFAAAFPLASILSIGCNLIEMRSDLYKLCCVCVRPSCKKANNIGTWAVVISTMGWLAIVTNTFIMGMTSDQLEQWFPKFFKDIDGPGAYDHRARKSGILLMFGIEHFLLLVSLAITAAVRTQPKWVMIDVQRREYEARQALAAERQHARDAKQR